jgi:hypothetical protein
MHYVRDLAYKLKEVADSAAGCWQEIPLFSIFPNKNEIG